MTFKDLQVGEEIRCINGAKVIRIPDCVDSGQIYNAVVVRRDSEVMELTKFTPMANFQVKP